MKFQVVAICGEADHPLLDQFKEHYKQFNPYIQMGVTKRWLSVNGDTSGSGLVFDEKVDQQNEALSHVDPDTDYIMTFDVDEFMSKSDFKTVMTIIEHDRPDVVTFVMNQFWHNDNYVAIGGDGWGYEALNPRIFRFTPGMQFVNHRPPTPNYPVKTVFNLPQRPNHYSYVYMNQVYRKLRYYNLIYTQFDYMKWFEEVWMKWNPLTRTEIESKYSIHPSCPGATTKLFTGKHDIEWT